MLKVIATDVSKKYNLRLKELHRVAQPGEIFEVTDDRFVYLNGNNPKGYVVVEWYQEPEEEIKETKTFDDIVDALDEVAESYNVEVKFKKEDEPTIKEALDTAIMSDEPVVEEVPVEKPKKKRTTKKTTETEEAPVKKTRKKKEE